MIDVKVSGLNDLRLRLDQLGPRARHEAEIAVANYMLLQVTTKTIPPRKYITRRAAYDVPFFSKWQRRWFFGALRTGAIRVPYIRRGKRGGIATHWKIMHGEDGVELTNDAPGVEYVIGDGKQSRHEKMVGWKTISQIASEKSKQLRAVLERSVQKTIRTLGLS